MNVLKKSKQWFADRRKNAEEYDAETDKTKNQKIKIPIEKGFLNDRSINVMIMIITLCMVLIHFIYAQYIFMSIEVYRTMHMCFGLVICLLLTMKDASKRGVRILHFVFVLMIAFSFAYIALNVDAIRLRAWMNTDLDLIVGVALIAMAYYMAGKHFGWFLSILTFIVMIYPMFGQYFTGALRTTSYSITQTITNLSIGLTGGVYASISISADFIFLFMVLGGVMGAVGVQSLFVEVGKLLVGRFRSGSAQITAVSGALFGTVSGAAISIAALCAPFCIPNMRKDGYGKVESAAILGASATGGIILPPIMGAVAFGVAGFANIPYWTICKMAIIPAVLYYGSIMLYAHLRAMKNPILRNRPKEKPVINYDLLKWKAASFVIPFILILVMLSKGLSVTKTAFYASLAVVICGYATKKQYRPKFKEIIKGIVDGGITGAKLAVCIACLGILITTFSTSGLNVKLAATIASIGGGNMFLILLTIYFIIILAGMAGVVLAAYFTVAAFSISVLTNLGVDYNVAHFFTAYPAFFATITPPVAIASMMVSKMAGTRYGPTAIETCKTAIAGFIVPFLFCYAPAIVLQGDMTSIWSWVDILIATISFASIQFLLARYYLTKLNVVEMSILGLSIVTFMLFFGQRYLFLLIGGFAGILVVTALQFIKFKKSNSNSLPTGSLESTI